MSKSKIFPKMVFVMWVLFFIESVSAQVDIFENKRGNVPGINNDYAKASLATTYPNIRLTNNTGSSENPRMACDANYCYIVWQDNRDGNYEIYWCKTNHNGTKVINDTRVTNSGGASLKPSISIDNSGNSYVVWQEGSGWGVIYFCKLDVNGTKTISDKNLTDGLCSNPDISTTPTGVSSIVYERMAPATRYLLYKKLDASGNEMCTRELSNWDITNMEKNPSIESYSTSESFVTWRDINNWVDGLWIGRVNSSCNVIYDSRVFTSQDARYSDITLSPGFFWKVFQNKDGTGKWKIYNYRDVNNACKISQGAGNSTKPKLGTDNSYGYTVWQDDRDGNPEIYICQFYACSNISGDIRITNDLHNSVSPDIYVIKGSTAEFYIVWQDDRDGNDEIYWSKNNPCGPLTFIVKDSLGGTLQDSTIVKHLRTGQIDTTDINGEVSFNDVCPGDEIYANKLIGWGRTDKGATHPILDPVNGYYAFYENCATNNYIDSQDTLRYWRYQGNNEIYLTDTIVFLNLVMSYERVVDKPNEELDKLREKFKLVNNFVFNATNGQVLIKKVDVFDGQKYLNEADIQIVNNKSTGVGVAPIDLHLPPNYVFKRTHIYFDDRFLRDNSYRYPNTGKVYNFQTGLIHELGHYFLSLGEEYKLKKFPYIWEKSFDLCVSNSETELENYQASIMSSYKLGKLIQEFCRNNHNANINYSGGRESQHHAHHKSCWDFVVEDWKNTFNRPDIFLGPYVFGDSINWKLPDIPPGEYYQEGPFTNLQPEVNDSLSHAVAKDVKFSFRDLIRRIIRDIKAFKISPFGSKASKNSSTPWGETPSIYGYYNLGSADEPVEIMGLTPTDKILFDAFGYSPVIVDASTILDSSFKITMEALSQQDDIFKILEADVPSNGDCLNLKLRTKNALPSPPQVTVLQEDAPSEISVIMTDQGNNVFSASMPLIDSLPYKGLVWFSDSSYTGLQYWEAQYITSPEGSYLTIGDEFQLFIPENSISNDCYITVVSSPLPKDMIEMGAIPLIQPYSISLSQGSNFISGASVASFVGEEFIDSSLSFCKWDTITQSWVSLPDTVDTLYQSIFSSLTENGIYTIFAVPNPDPQLILNSPSGGEFLASNCTTTVSWSKAIGSASDSLKLYLSLDGGRTYPLLIHRSVNDDSTSQFDWLVPDTLCSKGKILVMYYLPSDQVVYDESDLAFIIYKLGDINCDTLVSVSDVVYLINYLFKYGPALCPTPKAGEVNGDGKVSVSDVVYLINYLFKGGPPPVC